MTRVDIDVEWGATSERVRSFSDVTQSEYEYLVDHYTREWSRDNYGYDSSPIVLDLMEDYSHKTRKQLPLPFKCELFASAAKVYDLCKDEVIRLECPVLKTTGEMLRFADIYIDEKRMKYMDYKDSKHLYTMKITAVK